MFYSIGVRTPSRLTKFRIDELISIDEGWSMHRTKGNGYIIYKGWADNGLENKVRQQNFDAEYGIYTIIHRTKDRINVYRDNHRNSPEVISPKLFGNDLFLIENAKDQANPLRQFEITPINQLAYWDIYTSTVKLEENNEIKDWHKDIIKTIKFNSLTLDQCAEAVTDHISKRLKKFFEQFGHKKTIIRPTGGYDACAIASIALKNNFPIEVHKPFNDIDLADREELLLEMSNLEKYPKYESYQVTKYMPNTNVLLGAMDSYIMSEPWYFPGLYKELYDQLIMYKDSYSYHHIFEHSDTEDFDTSNKIKMIKESFNPNRGEAIWKFAQMSMNNLAEWHWKDQLVCVPYRDFYVTSLMLQVQEQFIPTMIMDKALQRKIIEINCPDLLALLNKSSKDRLLPPNLPNNVKKYFANQLN